MRPKKLRLAMGRPRLNGRFMLIASVATVVASLGAAVSAQGSGGTHIASQAAKVHARAHTASRSSTAAIRGTGPASKLAAAQTQPYPPDGPDFPTVTLNEGPAGAAGLPPLNPPKPNGFDQQSIWNMKVVGFNDNQGRPSSDDGWVENQDGRYIAYVTDNGSCPTPTQAGPCPHNNPLTGQMELDGTTLIDATDPSHPFVASHIPTTSGSSTHLSVCGGNTLPDAKANGLMNRWFLLRADGNKDWEIWDTSDPSHPKFLTTLIGNGVSTHHVWWECDTGIAYVIFQQQGDGWHESDASQHVYIYDLSNPAKPKFIRQFGLPGQQPGADVASQQSCYNAPSSTCFEGVTNPPTGMHELYSAGTKKNLVFFGYGSSSNGVDQIVDRNKLLHGCDPTFNPAASPHCANDPTQADLLYPQISYLTQNPQDGGHTFVPIFGVPIPQAQQNFLDGSPERLDLAVNMSEDTTNDCLGQKWKNPSILDISNLKTPYPISTATVGQFPGNFCAKGARFGTHEIARQIYAPYYGKILITAYFNGGLRVFDIRDPYNPRLVAYFMQAPNQNTITSCGTFQGNPNYCRKATFSDLGEVDDRGYIYNMDRAGSGLTILKLTGAAAEAVTGQGGGGQ